MIRMISNTLPALSCHKSTLKSVLQTLALLGLAAVCLSCCAYDEAVNVPGADPEQALRPIGVCPPFPLRDARGEIINPVAGINVAAPYSPRQTCGAEGCHDYEKITEAYHFTQGKGESVPERMAERYAWVTFPGNYGGNWCSPAPLYLQLAAKKNESAREIDMTSFSFILAGCGGCHPGGGSLEYDRDGKKYDEWMNNPASGYSPGGDNDFDGDYYKARWSETGIIEADCMLCHMPAYDLKKRNAQLSRLNFRWAATVGAGFAVVTGSVKDGQKPVVTYDQSRFDAAGNIIAHIAPEVRNETCLQCHFKPGWKKRGAEFGVRTDVHMIAGMRCVDCHSSGSRASDPRVGEREDHNFGKGDCPSGWVRNDLDNTARTCEQCHVDGWRNAPRASHAWLPPLHMEHLACQACHIPARAVKSALVQAGDVYNTAPRISPPAKRTWTFYDQHMNFWNHYGELNLFTEKDKPTNLSRPTLIRYKGKIFPANRVHSAFVGFEEEGVPGLNQLFMKDYHEMWELHRADPLNTYPELARITDDNKDGTPEINRAEEIDAVLSASLTHLVATGFPLERRRLVYVANQRVYYSSKEYRDVPKDDYEASPYASVYKFSHDIAPARAALGAGGCTDCHAFDAAFFRGAVLEAPFTGDDAQPKWIPNHAILDIAPLWVHIGAFREEFLKPIVYALALLVLMAFTGLGVRYFLVRRLELPEAQARWAGTLATLCAFAGFAGLVLSNEWLDYILVRRFTLDANHAVVSVLCLFLVLMSLLLLPQKRQGGMKYGLPGVIIIASFMLAVVSGILMVVKLDMISVLSRLSYTTFELALAVGLVTALALSLRRLLASTRVTLS